MWLASFIRSPTAFVLEARSEPARSTKCSLLVVTPAEEEEGRGLVVRIEVEVDLSAIGVVVEKEPSPPNDTRLLAAEDEEDGVWKEVTDKEWRLCARSFRRCAILPLPGNGGNGEENGDGDAPPEDSGVRGGVGIGASFSPEEKGAGAGSCLGACCVQVTVSKACERLEHSFMACFAVARREAPKAIN
mmetsp:Transcript_40281/g.81257  ORF Transcript_40281/g.81257 Transcript_40281/m.81257 type:complete len:188 (-) Transcript_40281:194-757(-)